jgi:hypothetical protein
MSVQTMTRKLRRVVASSVGICVHLGVGWWEKKSIIVGWSPELDLGVQLSFNRDIKKRLCTYLLGIHKGK